MGHNILAPAAVLVLWSLVMLVWMAATRFPAIAKSGMDLSKAKPGGRGQNLDGVLPDKVQWKAHNYIHLMEQPTLFYATVLILHVVHAASPLMVAFAWGYTILRMAHSVWQATVNTIVPVRFGLFFLSSVCLIVLAIKAVIATI